MTGGAHLEPRAADCIDERYELLRPIARGGAGSVFEAVHLITHRHVAVKLLNPDLRSHPEARARLLREARALTLVTHRNVVGVIDSGIDKVWGPFLAMELLEGRLLGGILAARVRLAPRDAVAVALQVCEALGAAHVRGVVHRDVKPDNIFIARNNVGVESAKLLDFGIASMRGEPGAPSDQKLTALGALLGTPEYMAPEQLTGEPALDERCDVYGLGITLYECLTGDVPYEGTVGRIVQQLWTTPVPSPRERCPELPEPLAQIVVRAMARPPEERFPTAAALAEELQRVMPVQSRLGSLLGITSGDAPRDRQRTAPTRPLDAPEHEPKPIAPTDSVDAPEHEPKPTAPTRPVDAPAREPEPTAPTDSVDAPAREPKPTAPTRPVDIPELQPEAVSVGQRRRHARAPYVTPVTVARANGSTLFGRSEDISAGGILVVTGQPCERPEVVTIRFALPETGRFAEVRAVARWARQARGVGATGFEFIAPAADVLEAIGAHVARITAAAPSGHSDEG